jgi:hypothetical protein
MNVLESPRECLARLFRLSYQPIFEPSIRGVTLFLESPRECLARLLRLSYQPIFEPSIRGVTLQNLKTIKA